MPLLTHGVLVAAHQLAQAPVRKALGLEEAQLGGAERFERAALQRLLQLHELFDLRQEPGVDGGFVEDFRQRHADAEGVAHEQDALGAGIADLVDDLVAVGFLAARALAQAVDAGLQAAQRLLEALLEGAAHGHDLADALHLRRQVRVGGGELLEGEARDLRHHVVDAGLEARRRGAAGDVVAQFVERVAHGQLGRHLGDRKARGLGGEGGAAAHARVHLDDDEAAVGRVHRELHVGAAGVDADLAQDGDAGVAHHLVFLVGERLRRGHRDAVAGVDAHRIEVLDAAHDDAVVGAVAHDLHLELFPADQALLDQQLLRRAQVEAALADLFELFRVVGDAAAGAAHREAGADDHREPGAADLGLDALLHRQRFFHAVRDAALGRGQADGRHRVLELHPVFGLLDGLLVGADHLDAVLGQHAVAVQIERAVQRRLAAHRGQQGHRLVRMLQPLLGDDLLHHLPGDGLDVGGVGHAGVGHDRCRVAVDQHDAIALFAQRLAGLRAGVVELAGLADDDGAGADDEDALQVGTLRHGPPPWGCAQASAR
jgi:hypothetical protein